MGVAVNWDAFFNRHQSLGYKELARRMEQEGTIIVDVFNDMFKDPELKALSTAALTCMTTILA
jgi:hypothetical protein